MFKDIPLMSEEYVAAAAEALAAGYCPDCPGEVRPMAPVFGALWRKGMTADAPPAHVLECLKCDTEWIKAEGPAGDYAWRRSQRFVSIMATATGRHPYLAMFTEAMTTEGVALELDDAPVFVNAAVATFPLTVDEVDRMNANGMFIYMPPSQLNEVQHDTAAAVRAAAAATTTGAAESPATPPADH